MKKISKFVIAFLAMMQKPAKVSTSDRRKVSTHFTGEDFVILLAKGH
ncbi:MAG: hypothetical protein M3Q56_13210 [Bacteroidota bacterium]|nr:hypothetical protein [Bacteroidota bacterium]